MAGICLVQAFNRNYLNNALTAAFQAKKRQTSSSGGRRSADTFDLRSDA